MTGQGRRVGMNHRWNAAAFLECGAAALFLICLFRCLVVESAHLLPVCAVFLPLLAVRFLLRNRIG